MFDDEQNPPGFNIRTFENVPEDLVTDYRLDTMLPQPQRQVWPSDRPSQMGSEDDD